MEVAVFANRLPVIRTPAGWRPAAGGLVTALRPVLEENGGRGIGWSGTREDSPSRVDGLGFALLGVPLGPRITAGYYNGFSNQTLWPLFHDLVHPPVIDHQWWRAYQAANEAFARSGEVGYVPGSVRWVHDYHLMLVPRMLRSRGSAGPILYFLHTPFPAPELFARLPWREELLAGVLGADVVGFHTRDHQDNFIRSCRRFLPDVTVSGDLVHAADGRTIRCSARPISVDAAGLSEHVQRPDVQRQARRLRDQYGPRRVMLGVDRLDYTKGILQRLRALERLLERRPDLRGAVTLIQIAEPSRNEEPRYRQIREEVEQLVGRINGRFTQPGRAVPVRYMYRSMPPERLLPYYVMAEVALVTPLRDGMNLVAKEYVACQAATGGHGVLVLSEFAGAAEELHGAVRCNPFDEEGLSGRIEAALEVPRAEARSRMEAMGAYVHHHDVFRWARSMLAMAGEPARGRARGQVDVRADASIR
jgi:trehalose 6-phosphate synthase